MTQTGDRTALDLCQEIERVGTRLRELEIAFLDRCLEVGDASGDAADSPPVPWLLTFYRRWAAALRRAMVAQTAVAWIPRQRGQ